jgi:hypothetical protein
MTKYPNDESWTSSSVGISSLIAGRAKIAGLWQVLWNKVNTVNLSGRVDVGGHSQSDQLGRSKAGSDYCQPLNLRRGARLPQPSNQNGRVVQLDGMPSG